MGAALAFSALLHVAIRSSAAASGTDSPIPEPAEQVNQAAAGAVAGNENVTAQSVSQVAAGEGATAEAPGPAQAAHVGNDTEQEATGTATAEYSAPASAEAPGNGETADVEATSDAGTENSTTQTVGQTGTGTQTAVRGNTTTQTAVATATTSSTTFPTALATVESTRTTVGPATDVAGTTPPVVLNETFAESTASLLAEQPTDRSTTGRGPRSVGDTPWVHATGARVSAALMESLPDGATAIARSAGFLSGPVADGSAAAAFTDAQLLLAAWVGQGGWSTARAPAGSVPASGAPVEFGLPMPAVPSWSSGLWGTGGSSGGGGALAGMAGIAVLAAVLALALPPRIRSLTTEILSMRSRLYFPVPVGPD